MAGHCIFLTVITLYVIQQLNLILAAPTSNHHTAVINFENKINKNDNLEFNEIQFKIDSNEKDHHVEHKRHKRSHHHHNNMHNACNGRLVDSVKTISVASTRQLAMNLFFNIINNSKDDLEYKNINANDFEAILKHANRYNFLKIAEENDEPKLSEWHFNMQIYTHTFEYLHRHQMNLHTKCSSDSHTYTYLLEELKISSKKMLCELQSMAYHLEEKPQIKSLTTEEKHAIENNLITNEQSKCVNEVDINYTKKLHFDNINGMRRSLRNCMKDCSCVKGNGECKNL